MQKTKKLTNWVQRISLLLILGLAACEELPSPKATFTTVPLQNTLSPTPASTSLNTEEMVTFETVDQDTYGPNVTDIIQPQLFWIGNREDVERIRNLVNVGTYDRLVNLDFEKYAAIAAFRGREPTSGYDILIQRIVRQDGKLVIYAQLWEPSPAWEIQTVGTFSYHVVRIPQLTGLNEAPMLILQGEVITPTPPPNWTSEP